MNFGNMLKSLLFSCLILCGCSSRSGAQYASPSPQYVDLTAAAENSVDAVVYIKTEFMQKNSVWDDFFGGTIWEYFFGMTPSNFPVQAGGSGVIVSPDGYIMTNNHVVQDAVKITVTLNDKREYSGKVIGTEPTADLALIKIDAKDLTFLEFANSDSARIGEWVLAVGNPLNLNSTVTAGIISAKARQLEIPGYNKTEESYLQTDAAVNPGNSGGPLVNASGKLIGINTAIASGNGYYTGYSFAIPSNIVNKVYYDLRTYGQVQRAYLGVSLMELDARTCASYGLDDVKGIYVAKVEDDGAAARKDFHEGDVILKMDNKPVNNIAEVRGVLKTKSPGDKINVIILRNKEKLNKIVTLLNDNGTTDIVRKKPEDTSTGYNR